MNERIIKLKGQWRMRKRIRFVKKTISVVLAIVLLVGVYLVVKYT